MLPKDVKSIMLQGSPSDAKKASHNNQIFKANKKNTAPIGTKLKNNLYFKKATKAVIHEALCELLNEDDEVNDDNEEEIERSENNDDNDSTLLVNSSTCKSISPADIRKLLSVSKQKKDLKSSKTSEPKSTPAARKVNNAIMFKLSSHSVAHSQSLVDRGANGRVAGEDVRVIWHNVDRRVDVCGIDNHEITSIPLFTSGGITNSFNGEIIIIINQCAYYGKERPIHSSGQLEYYENLVDDKSVKFKGTQCIVTNDGFKIPIRIKNDLPHIPLRPCADEEWDTLPQILLTSDTDWDPIVLDCPAVDSQEWIDAQSDFSDTLNSPLFNEFGDYKKREIVSSHDLCFFDSNTYPHEEDIEDVILRCVKHSQSNNAEFFKKEPDYSMLQPFFNYLLIQIIKKTFSLTTQHAKTPESTILKKNFKSPFPALNVSRRNEPVATDTVYSDTPSINDGSTSAQIFVGTETLFTDVCGMKSDKQFVNTLEDNIRTRRAMDKLISDRAQVEISKRVLDILRALFIDYWQSEPHRQYQNPAERRC